MQQPESKNDPTYWTRDEPSSQGDDEKKGKPDKEQEKEKTKEKKKEKNKKDETKEKPQKSLFQPNELHRTFGLGSLPRTQSSNTKPLHRKPKAGR